MLKKAILFIFLIIPAIILSDRLIIRPVEGRNIAEKKERPAILRRGERLFRDDRFSTSKGDLPASCSTCHLLDEDPQGLRAYADFFNRSWVSSRIQDPRRLELRNSPTLFDVGEMERLHYDGEFPSLEALVKGTLSGRPMGWLPGEESAAFDHVFKVLINDRAEGPGAAGTYREEFRKTFNVDLEKIDRERALGLVAKAIAEFTRTLKTRKDSAYDKFALLNGLDASPAVGEDGPAFGQKTIARLTRLEQNKTLKFIPGFGQTELDGLKIFLRTEGENSTGNCVACHTPPNFTDRSFHNKGISQREYDKLHGEGRFAALVIPDASATVRPSSQFREIPSPSNPALVDLGHWNFVDLKQSPLRRAGETDDAFLRRMIGTFKTPTLRNLAHTQPYFHDGLYHKFDEILEEMRLISEMARESRIRQADEELLKIRISKADFKPLSAFLDSLNEDLRRGY